jgi:diguanylate cyclase
MDEIEQVMAMIDAAQGSATSYTESLAEVTQRLDQSKACAHREGDAGEQPASGAAAERLQKEINGLQENLEAVRSESLTDLLTQLANRKFFDDSLESCIAEARARNEALSLMMTEIDHFKRFNDSFGHLTGDQVLKLVALSVKQNVKGQDIAARYGGEEFAVGDHRC